MILDLAYYGEAVLRKKAEPVTEISDEIKKLAQDMKDTLLHHNGLGIAAPQVKHSVRMFYICLPLDDPSKDDGRALGEPELFINPVLSSPSEETDFAMEGCLSIPGLYEEVERPVSLRVEAMNLNGEMFSKEFTGLPARVVMHENDHINGVLFFDRIKGKKRKQLDSLLRDVKKKFYLQSKK